MTATRAATRTPVGRLVVVHLPDGDVTMPIDEVRRHAMRRPAGVTATPAEREGNVLIGACQTAMQTMPPIGAPS